MDWNIQSRSRHCQACERAFADKERYHTVLLDEKSEYVRKDVCEACWSEQFAESSKQQREFVSYWQGVFEEPPPAPPEPIEKESAASLLRKLMELNDPDYAAASYILAVMLERKRVLKVREQFKRNGVRVFVYEQPKTGDVYTIPDPNLQLDQLDEVQKQVADLLEHGFNPPSEETTGTETPHEPPPNQQTDSEEDSAETGKDRESVAT